MGEEIGCWNCENWVGGSGGSVIWCSRLGDVMESSANLSCAYFKPRPPEVEKP